jgi:hypothetical protein
MIILGSGFLILNYSILIALFSLLTFKNMLLQTELRKKIKEYKMLKLFCLFVVDEH